MTNSLVKIHIDGLVEYVVYKALNNLGANSLTIRVKYINEEQFLAECSTDLYE